MMLHCRPTPAFPTTLPRRLRWVRVHMLSTRCLCRIIACQTRGQVGVGLVVGLVASMMPPRPRVSFDLPDDWAAVSPTLFFVVVVVVVLVRGVHVCRLRACMCARLPCRVYTACCACVCVYQHLTQIQWYAPILGTATLTVQVKY